MPGMVAVVVAGNGVLLFATVGVIDTVSVAVNVRDAVGLAQPVGIPQGVGLGILRGAGGFVLL